MKQIALLSLILLTSCSSLFEKEALTVAKDSVKEDAARVTITREALQKDTNVHVQLDITNKDNVPK